MTDLSLAYYPELSQASMDSWYAVNVKNSQQQQRKIDIVAEHRLELSVDGQALGRLSTLGNHPEALVLGYVRTLLGIDNLKGIESVQVDWDEETATVHTHYPSINWQHRQQQVQDDRGEQLCLNKPERNWSSQLLLDLLDNIQQHRKIYQQHGALQGCGLCQDAEPLMFVEDVNSQHAIHVIAGYMWLSYHHSEDKILYINSCITEDTVLQIARIGIPIIISSAGVTHRAVELAEQCHLILIRQLTEQNNNKHDFEVYSGHDSIVN